MLNRTISIKRKKQVVAIAKEFQFRRNFVNYWASKPAKKTVRDEFLSDFESTL